jgi:hypothetical protein
VTNSVVLGTTPATIPPVTDAPPPFIKVRVFSTVVTVTALGSMAGILGAQMMALSNKQRAVLLRPIHLAHTGIILHETMLYTAVAVTCAGSMTRLADRMANSNILRADVPSPCLISHTVPILIPMSMRSACVAVTGFWA